MDEFSDLAEFLASGPDVPRVALDKARDVFFDFLGTAIAGHGDEAVGRMTSMRTRDSGQASTVLRGPDFPRAGDTDAAFLNGLAAAGLEFDEGNKYYVTHGSVHVAPAALAVAEASGAAGGVLLRAIALGYEVAVRLGRACTPRRGAHPHGAWPTVGCAAAAGVVLGLPAPAMREALALAAGLMATTSWTSGIEGATVRNAYVGHAAAMGVLAAQAAASGLTGGAAAPRESFEAIAERVDWASLTDGLGAQYLFLDNYHKPYPACQWIHSAVDCAIGLHDDLAPFDVDDVQQVRVDTFAQATDFSSTAPVSALAAKFSLPYCVATALLTGRLTVDSFAPDMLSRPDVRALTGKVTLAPNDDYTASYPRQRPASMTIRLGRGEEATRETLAARGYETPFGWDDLVAKFVATTESFLPAQAQRRLVARCRDLEAVEDVSSLFALPAGEPLEQAGSR